MAKLPSLGVVQIGDPILPNSTVGQEETPTPLDKFIHQEVEKFITTWKPYRVGDTLTATQQAFIRMMGLSIVQGRAFNTAFLDGLPFSRLGKFSSLFGGGDRHNILTWANNLSIEYGDASLQQTPTDTQTWQEFIPLPGHAKMGTFTGSDGQVPSEILRTTNEHGQQVWIFGFLEIVLESPECISVIYREGGDQTVFVVSKEDVTHVLAGSVGDCIMKDEDGRLYDLSLGHEGKILSLGEIRQDEEGW